MALGSGAKGANYSVVKNREKETNLTQLSLHLKAEVGLWVGGVVQSSLGPQWSQLSGSGT